MAARKTPPRLEPIQIKPPVGTKHKSPMLTRTGDALRAAKQGDAGGKRSAMLEDRRGKSLAVQQRAAYRRK